MTFSKSSKSPTRDLRPIVWIGGLSVWNEKTGGFLNPPIY